MTIDTEAKSVVIPRACAGCQYWACNEESIEKETLGECRASPPVFRSYTDHTGHFPLIAANKFCGSFDAIQFTDEEVEFILKHVEAAE